MPRICIALMVAVACWMALCATALADRRVALVVGNSAYQQTAVLPNPRNDAADMAVALKTLGFEVIEGLDLNKGAFDRKILAFANALSGASVGVFFYAGHGLQLNGQNFLVPVDAKAENETAIDFELVRVEIVQRAMERSASTDVMAETERKQIPWEHSALTGRFYFNSPKAGEAPQAPPRQERQLDRDWELVKDSNDPAVLQAFISAHKGTLPAALADARIRALKEAKFKLPAPAAPTVPPSPGKTPPAGRSSACAPAGFRVLATIPPSGVGAIGKGEKIYVTNGQCGPGHILQIIGGSKEQRIPRQMGCVPCR
jgi:hypothetical protein